MDDDIRQFAWAQLRSKANVFIRQPRFLEVSDSLAKQIEKKNEISQELKPKISLSRWTLPLWRTSLPSLSSTAMSGNLHKP